MHKVQFISQGNSAAAHVASIQLALDAGVQWIQLRVKNVDIKTYVAIAEQVKRLTEKYKATYIINDLIEVAKVVDADGLHLGLGDADVSEARAILGKDKIIGGTANTLFDIEQRIAEGVDYIGLGPMRFTSTKQNLSPILGIEGYKNIIEKMSASVPVYAIGGILPEDIKALVGVGVYGVALSGVLLNSEDPKKTYDAMQHSFLTLTTK